MGSLIESMGEWKRHSLNLNRGISGTPTMEEGILEELARRPYIEAGMRLFREADIYKPVGQLLGLLADNEGGVERTPARINTDGSVSFSVRWDMKMEDTVSSGLLVDAKGITFKAYGATKEVHIIGNKDGREKDHAETVLAGEDLKDSAKVNKAILLALRNPRRLRTLLESENSRQI